jgi:hypothetical protein
MSTPTFQLTFYRGQFIVLHEDCEDFLNQSSTVSELEMVEQKQFGIFKHRV